MRVLYRFLILSGFTSRAKLGLAGYPNRRALCKHLTDARFHILRQLSGPHQCVIWNNTSTGHCFTSGIIPENLKKSARGNSVLSVMRRDSWENPKGWRNPHHGYDCCWHLHACLWLSSSYWFQVPFVAKHPWAPLNISPFVPIKDPLFMLFHSYPMRSIAGISSRGPIRQSPQRAWNSSRSPVANLGTFPTFQVATGQGWSITKKNGGFCTWNAPVACSPISLTFDLLSSGCDREMNWPFQCTPYFAIMN